jgi:protein required for attachment to host cells
MKPVRTWILVADGARARVYESLGKRGDVTEREELRRDTDLPPTRELDADRPGRGNVPTTAHRHGFQPTSDSHRELKRDFAEDFAALLEEQLAAGAYDRLVLVAAPVTLGDLREALSDRVRGVVTAELDKDLTKHSARELGAQLQDVLTL